MVHLVFSISSVFNLNQQINQIHAFVQKVMFYLQRLVNNENKPRVSLGKTVKAQR